MKKVMILTIIFLSFLSIPAQDLLSGKVYGIDGNGNKSILPGANIIYIGTAVGTASNSDGLFSIPKNTDSNLLAFSFVGYESDTIDVSGRSYIEVTLKSSAGQVKDVEITAERSTTVLDYRAVEHTHVITKRELQKAACCDLSESFETNPSVDVSVTDAITGVKQIEMLGLSGAYTQKTLEAIPYLRGLNSNIGLTFLPGTWIESINVSKGIGSVVNGFESITGQVDVAMVKPFDPLAKNTMINIYGNNDQRFEGNFNFRKEFGSKLSAITLLHASSRQSESDINKDNFMDLPRFNTFNVLQKWKYFGDSDFESQMGIQYFRDKKNGGTIDGINNSVQNVFRFQSENENLRVYGKAGYIFPNSSYKSIGFQWAFNKFDNKSLYGNRDYTGSHSNVFLNLIYQSSLFNEHHKFRTGISFLFDEFDETFNGADYNRIERIPGAYFEYTYSPEESFSTVAGFRVDEHNFYGTMFTPRLHLRYSPDPDWVFRGVAGKGYRTPNIFTEYSSVFVSSRQTAIRSDHSYGYGLGQDEAWNFGFNITHYFLYQWREATLSLDFYRTQFVNALIADIDSDPGTVIFSDVKNGINSNSFQAELNIEPFERIDTRIAYRYLNVRQKINGVWKSKPLNSEHRMLFNIGYTTENYIETEGWAFDLTLQWFGSKRIPSVFNSEGKLLNDPESPDFLIANTQITKRFSFGFDLYIGIENLFDVRQNDPIIDPFNPDSEYFDASLVWGPVSGRMAYAGIRLEM